MFEKFMIKHLEKKGFLVLSDITMDGLRYGFKNLFVINKIKPLEKKRMNKISFKKNQKNILTSKK